VFENEFISIANKKTLISVLKSSIEEVQKIWKKNL
jgi:hypothetical protein